jgi:hypothetical protein
MTQTKHFTAGGNPDSHVQVGKLHWLLLITFLLKKKKKNPKILSSNFAFDLPLILEIHDNFIG